MALGSRAVFKGSGLWDQPPLPKCSHQKLSTLFQYISAVVVVNIVTILSRNSAFSFHVKRSVILKSAEKAFVARAPPRTRLRSSRRFSRLPSRAGRGTPLPNPRPLDAFGVSISASHFSEPSEFFVSAFATTPAVSFSRGPSRHSSRDR